MKIVWKPYETLFWLWLNSFEVCLHSLGKGKEELFSCTEPYPFLGSPGTVLPGVAESHLGLEYVYQCSQLAFLIRLLIVAIQID